MPGRRTILAILSLLVGGCAPKATPAECQRACERVAQLEVGPLKKEQLLALHELEERVEATEDQAKADLARIAQELAAGSPAFDEKAFRARGASAAEIRTARERHAWEAQQLRNQRESAIAQTKQHVEGEKKGFAEAKKKAEADMKQALAVATGGCNASCGNKSRRRVECLMRTQAIEDVAICNAD